MSQTKAQLIDPVDGTIVNADINASAAIAGSKISPDFGSQNIATTGTLGSGDMTITGSVPALAFTESDGNPDFTLRSDGGIFRIRDVTNTSDRIQIQADGTVDITGNLDAQGGLDVTGAITSTGGASIEGATVFNETGADVDFRIEGDSNANLFKLDASNDRIGIGQASPVTTLDVNGDVTITDKIIHGGDTDTAIRFHGADSFSVETGGTQRFSVSNSGTTLSTTTDASLFINSTASGGAHLRIQSSGTNKTFLGQAEGIAGALGGANDFAIRSAGNINFAPNDTNTIKVKIDTSGRLLVGTTSPVTTDSNGHAKFVAVSSAGPNIQLGNDTTDIDNNARLGTINYSGNHGGTFRELASLRSAADADHTASSCPSRLEFYTTGTGNTGPTERFRFGNSGQIGIAGANYGTSGQALVSQGASAAPQWASVSSVTTGAMTALDSVGESHVFGSIPATAIIVRILFQNLFASGSGRPMFRVGHAGSGGTLLTSGYKGYTGYVYRNQTYSPNNNSNSTMIPVVNAGWNNVSYKWNGYIDFIRVGANASNQSQSWITETYLRENNSNYWDSVGGTQYNVYFYGQSQIYMGDNISLDRIEVNANGSSSGQTLGGNATLQYFE